MIIAFDGLDGCGKSTYIKRLVDHYEAKGYRVKVYGNPGGTEQGLAIRQIVKGQDVQRHKGTDLLMFASVMNDIMADAKIYHEQGYLVFIDRWLMSAFGYQKHFNGLGNVVDHLYRFTLPNFWKLNNIPNVDIMFWVDVPYRLLKDRLEQRDPVAGDIYEGITEEWFDKVRGGYLEYFEQNKEQGYTVEMSARNGQDQEIYPSVKTVNQVIRVEPVDNTKHAHNYLMERFVKEINALLGI